MSRNTMRGPVLHSGRTTRALMGQVILALAPICVASVWRHGAHAGGLLAVAVVTAVVLDAVCDRPNALDGGAVIIGLLLALMLPVQSPLWVAAAGSAIAVLLGKHAFGGVGANLFNPAAVGRVALMCILPTYFFAPLWDVDGSTHATSLAVEFGAQPAAVADVLLGVRTVTLGEAAPLALIAGGLFLVLFRAIDWRLPLVYLATVSLLALCLPASDRMAGHAPWIEGNALLHLLSGGTLLGAFFMITDPVTDPFKRSGRIVFCVLAAAYAMLIRYYTPYPDGVAAGILLANATVPLIDRQTLGGSFPAVGGSTPAH